MKDGKIKKFLYFTKIIPLYSSVYSKIYWSIHNPEAKNEIKTDRWYFKFLTIKKDKIVFDNFLGKGYGDNPKAIAEEIIRQNLSWDLVWLTKEHHNDIPKQIRQVKYGSPEAMREMATAKMWIFNVRNVKHPKKRKKQVYLQTWHGGGIPLKKTEGMSKALSPKYVAAAKKDGQISDYIISSSSIRTEVFRKYFWINAKTEILEYGDPKLDVLFDKEKNIYFNKKIRNMYHLSEETGIIFYMPTFRDNLSTNFMNINFNKVLDTFEKKFGRKFVFFLRLHPNMYNTDLKIFDKRVINVTSYPEAEELFLATDFGISDYSSSMILDLPLIGKPVFIYASDFSDYKCSRGLTEYYKERLPLYISTTNEELIDVINNFDNDLYFKLWKKFISIDNSFDDGNASKRVVDLMKKILTN